MDSRHNRIVLDGIVIDVVRKNIKHLYLTIDPEEGRPRISSPLRVSDGEVCVFAESKLAWIKTHREKINSTNSRTRMQYVSGEYHALFGQRYLLSLKRAQSASKVILRDSSILELHVRNPSNVVQRQRVLSEWYRGILKDRIPSLIAKWQPIMGVSVNHWGVKRMKTRWGSCNIGAGRIWVNLELAKKPEPCLQYIVVHEMVHLLERKHGKRFKQYMDSFLPQWRSIDDLLTQEPAR